MDHETAIRMSAAERYWTNDLSSGERDQFEEHFFSCPECAEEVRWERIFAANAKAIFRDEARRPKAKRWWVLNIQPLFARPAFGVSALANVALAAGIAFMVGEIRTISSPHLGVAIAVPTVVRSEQKPVAVPPGTQVVSLSFALPRQFPQYAYSIIPEGGSPEYEQTVAAPAQNTEELLLSIPRRALPAGLSRVVLRGVEGGREVTIGESRIEIQR
jgi:hypothetical protein